MTQRTAVFDLDGTILNTLEDLKDSLNVMLTEYGLPLRTLDETRRFVGNGIRKLIERAVPTDTPAERIDEMHAFFSAYYGAHCADKTGPYPGIPEMIAALRAEGWKTAVVSNKSDQPVHILCEQFFPGLFDEVVGERTGVQRKPAPDSVNEVIRALGVRKEDCIYIGDSEVDLATAENAEIPCILVEWGFRDKLQLQALGGKYFAADTEQLHDLLNTLRN